MNKQFNTLKYSKCLTGAGVATEHANAHAEALSTIEFYNLYDKEGVNTMLTDAMEAVLTKHEKESTRLRSEMREEYKELRDGQRWIKRFIIAGLITTLLGAAGAIGTLIKLAFFHT